ncbi:MAG: hypothetical protein KAY58_04430, partial [Desulfobulbus sp.]|nr:hypothetical protein [Desulfobulbus sp.]
PAVRRLLDRLPAPVQHAYVLLVVLVGWVFFRADTFAHALAYLEAMVDFSRPPLFNSQLFLALNNEFSLTLAAAVIGSTPVFMLLQRWRTGRPIVPAPAMRWLAATAQVGSLGFVLVYSIAAVLGGAHNPFLYFRF